MNTTPNSPTSEALYTMSNIRGSLDFAIKQAERHGLNTIEITVPAARLYRRELTEHINSMKRARGGFGTGTRLFPTMNPTTPAIREPNWTKLP